MEKSGRKFREHIPNTIHHVIMRGNNRQKIFYNKKQFKHFLSILCDSTKKFDHKILAYCLMTNHVHLVIYVKQTPLSAVMQNINFRYARWANHQMKRIGHLFQARYHSIEVSNEEYLINLIRYIHLNPVQAKMVKIIDDYQWSSHNHYKVCASPGWIDISIITNAIKYKTKLSYSELMIQKRSDYDWEPDLYLSEAGKLIVKNNLTTKLNEQHNQLEDDKKFLPVTEVVKTTCHYLNISSSELLAPCRIHTLAKKRALIAHYMLKYCEMDMSQIAKYFRRTHATLTRQVIKITTHKTEHFSKSLIEKIEKSLEQMSHK